jgi:hypothetical protein
MIEVYGRASNKIVGIFEISDPQEILMFFLLRHGLPIASSCAGDGVCKKCRLSNDELSCQMRVGDIIQRVEFDYL